MHDWTRKRYRVIPYHTQTESAKSQTPYGRRNAQSGSRSRHGEASGYRSPRLSFDPSHLSHVETHQSPVLDLQHGLRFIIGLLLMLQVHVWMSNSSGGVYAYVMYTMLKYSNYVTSCHSQLLTIHVCSHWRRFAFAVGIAGGSRVVLALPVGTKSLMLHNLSYF